MATGEVDVGGLCVCANGTESACVMEGALVLVGSGADDADVCGSGALSTGVAFSSASFMAGGEVWTTTVDGRAETMGAIGGPDC